MTTGTAALDEARAAGEEMHELQRFSPALWGLAECALLRGDVSASVALTAGGYEASHDVVDASSLFPFLVTGTRARLAQQDSLAAQEWADAVSDDLRRRRIPGTMPAVDHAAGLIALAAGRTGKARELLESAHAGWKDRSRWWEGQWCAVDLARCAIASNRRTEASTLVDGVRVSASALGAKPLLDAAAEVGSRLDEHDAAQPWSPLTLREFEVAKLVAGGLTNREIAEELRITVRTAGSHLEHIRASSARAGSGDRDLGDVARNGWPDRRLTPVLSLVDHIVEGLRRLLGSQRAQPPATRARSVEFPRAKRPGSWSNL